MCVWLPRVQQQTAECPGFHNPTITPLIKSAGMMMNYNAVDSDINLAAFCAGLA